MQQRTAALRDFELAYLSNGSFRQIGTVAALAACPLHLQERPNVGTATKQRDVPQADSCTATNK